jgi:putative methyltransferase (TIGR04325 family)
MSVKKIAKKILPSFCLDIYRDFLSESTKWTGNYSDWESAKKDSEGYSSEKILSKVIASTMDVMRKKASYERDSVLFYDKNYDLDLLFLLYSVSNNGRDFVNVLDFGGSLGSTYFKNRKYLDQLKLKWYVVEQPNFADVGKNLFESEKLFFYSDLDKCLKENLPNVVIFSSVLQYLENPLSIITKVIKSKPKYIAVLRTPFTLSVDRICIQKVNPDVYFASYPCRIFNEAKFLLNFKGYSVIQSKFENDYLGDKIYFKSYILERD